MRVLAVTHDASRTGSVRAFLAALPVLRDRATELIVVTKLPGPLSEELRCGADRLMETPRPRVSQVRRMARVRSLDRFVPRVERSIARWVIREVRPDMVYASTVLTCEYVAAARMAGIPAVLHVHEGQPLSGWAFDRYGVDPSTVPLLAPSRFVARELEAMGATSVDVLLGPATRPVAPTAIRPDDLPWSAGSLRVVACGTVAPWKGTGEWLSAAERLPAVDGHTVEWAWVGTGVELAAMRRETAARGLGDRVHWIGERKEVAPYLASADLFVLPSMAEPLGLVLLEAASVGLPGVAFAVGGVPEILVDDRALAEPGDVAGLVDRIRAALADPALRHELLDASRPALLAGEVPAWRGHLAGALDRVVGAGHGGIWSEPA